MKTITRRDGSTFQVPDKKRASSTGRKPKGHKKGCKCFGCRER